MAIAIGGGEPGASRRLKVPGRFVDDGRVGRAGEDGAGEEENGDGPEEQAANDGRLSRAREPRSRLSHSELPSFCFPDRSPAVPCYARSRRKKRGLRRRK